MKVKTYAKVRLTIEVDCGAPWSSAEQVEHVHKQASKIAMERACSALNQCGIRIIEEPRVLLVAIEDTP